MLSEILRTVAATALAASLTNYGVKRLLPASDVKFLVVASTASICAAGTFSVLSPKYAQKLTKAYGYYDKDNKLTNPLFYRLSELFLISISLLSPVISRTVGQRMGIQVPGYLQTVGYFSLVGCVVALSGVLLNMAAAARAKPATN